MRILLLLSTSIFSGAENVACQIYNVLKAEKNEVAYCSPCGEIKQRLTDNGIEYLPLDKFSVKEVKRAIKEFKPDVIHAHDMRACLLAGMATKKIPVVGHIHNNWMDARKFSIRSIMFLFIARRLKHVFWVSRSAFEEYKFRRFLQNKSEVLYNVIDINVVREKAKTSPIQQGYDIVFLGRLTYQKNVERLVTIVGEIVKTIPNIKVAIVGSGELYSDIEKMIFEAGLVNSIQMLGYQKDPYGIVKNSKVLMLTSRWEGTPIVVLESLTLGTPVVSTPVDGVKDLIRNGENGYLSDDNQSLANEIVKIIQDDALLKELSNNARKTSENFNNLNKYKERLVTIYQNVLRK